MIDLRLGRWEDVLADVDEVDAVICDPPYGDRTHAGHDAGVGLGGKRRSLCYTAWTVTHVHGFVQAWAPQTRGWMACMTSDDLIPAWRAAYAAAGLCDFAPVPWVAPGSRVRLAGDGPSCWTVYLMVARPRNIRMARWGTLPGAYTIGAANHGTFAQGAQQGRHIGGKPLPLMRAIVRDYSRPGDLVCDPCAGGATTLLAAAIEGRRAVGSEVDPETYAKAQARIARGYTPRMRFDQIKGEQQDLLEGA